MPLAANDLMTIVDQLFKQYRNQYDEEREAFDKSTTDQERLDHMQNMAKCTGAIDAIIVLEEKVIDLLKKKR